MTGIEFEKAVIQQGQPLRITDQTITDKVVLQRNIVATGVVIENCTFEKDVKFENIDLNCGVKFSNCVFNKHLIFTNCTANNRDSNFNIDNCHVEFYGTIVENLHFIGRNQISRGINIKANSTINALNIDTIIARAGSVSITDSTVNNRFDIRHAKIASQFSVRGESLINAKMRFENMEVESIVLTDAIFNKSIHLFAGRVNSLTLNDGVFNNHLYVTGVPILGYLTIIGSEFKKSIDFKLFDKTNNIFGKLSKIYLASTKFEGQFIVNGNDCEISDLVIIASKQMEGALYFNSSNILKTKISGDSYSSNIVFNHCNFNELAFDFFYNYSNLSIISGKSYDENSSLTVVHSNLGKTHLFNMYLDSFEKINIYNSVLNDIVAANVKWFEDDKLNPDDIISHHTLEQRREIYRQLKYALEKQGNRIASLRFKALEMKSFKQELFKKVKWYYRMFNTDRFVLWLGQTNDFGLNWLKPVLLAIGFSLLFHFLIVVGISDELSYWLYLSSQSLKTTWSIYKENFSSLPQLMNPTHLLSRVYPENQNLTFTVYLLDYILKVILAFFIFQTVSAFRKYVK